MKKLLIMLIVLLSMIFTIPVSADTLDTKSILVTYYVNEYTWVIPAGPSNITYWR